MDKVKKLTVSEAFYSIQGEGMTTGRPSIFIRLAGCNLMCGGKGTEVDKLLYNGATWRCDSIEVWRKGKSYTHAELVEELNNRIDFINRLKQDVRIIFTGGEPMLQQNAIVEFCDYLIKQHGVAPFVEIETNGTIVPTEELVDWVDLFNVSPKLENSGEPASSRLKNCLKNYGYLNSQFKFVISSEDDLLEVNRIIKKYDIERQSVWLMPAASCKVMLTSVSKKVIEWAKEYMYNYSHRLHIEIWNQKTGV